MLDKIRFFVLLNQKYEKHKFVNNREFETDIQIKVGKESDHTTTWIDSKVRENQCWTRFALCSSKSKVGMDVLVQHRETKV